MQFNGKEVKVVTHSIVENGVRKASYQVKNDEGVLVAVGSAMTEYQLDGANKVTVFDHNGNVVTDIETSMVKAKHYLVQRFLDNPELFVVQKSKEELAKEKRRERDRARRLAKKNDEMKSLVRMNIMNKMLFLEGITNHA